jgi:ubiquitin-like protein Pup
MRALPQEQERKRVQKKGGTGDAGGADQATAQSKAEKLKGEMDDILEENAEEFIKSYVQKGGE